MISLCFGSASVRELGEQHLSGWDLSNLPLTGSPRPWQRNMVPLLCHFRSWKCGVLFHWRMRVVISKATSPLLQAQRWLQGLEITSARTLLFVKTSPLFFRPNHGDIILGRWNIWCDSCKAFFFFWFHKKWNQISSQLENSHAPVIKACLHETLLCGQLFQQFQLLSLLTGRGVTS